MDTLRRALAAAMILLAVIGLMPLIPVAFGYLQANVRQDSSATYYPDATATPTLRFINCVQDPTTLNLKKNDLNKGVTYYIRCTNNWVSPVSITVSVKDANTSGLAWSNATYSTSSDIMPGGYGCIQVGRTAGGNLTDNKNPGTLTVSYHAEVNQNLPAADLYAQVEFTGDFSFTTSPPANTFSCP
jgi:uncharacterized membrane protein